MEKLFLIYEIGSPGIPGMGFGIHFVQFVLNVGAAEQLVRGTIFGVADDDPATFKRVILEGMIVHFIKVIGDNAEHEKILLP